MINLQCLNIGLVSSVLGCSIYTILFLKLISYIQVNKWCRDMKSRAFNNGDFFLSQRQKTVYNLKEPDQKTEKDVDIEKIDKNLVHWPNNLNSMDTIYFIFVPT